MPQDPTPINIKTPDGDVVARQIVVEPTPQEITLVTGDELTSLQSYAMKGPTFVSTYFPKVTSPDLNDYDNAFRAWQLSNPKKYTNEEVTQILGAVLGNLFCADLNMQWVIVKDKFGTDYAVRGKTFEVLSFPFSSVLKRIEDDKYDFMYAVYHTTKNAMTNGESKPRDSGNSNMP